MLKPELIIRLMVGLVFLSEGLQKFLFPEIVGAGRFRKLGVFAPDMTGYIVGFIEIICSICILLRFKVRVFVLPLFVVMLGALYYTKLPTLIHEGFWKTAHEGRTDFSMIMGLLFLYLSFRKSK
jgi:putative oxidoreductase